MFDRRDVETLTLLASQAAVAIKSARLYEAVRANEVRLEKEMRFAQRVQMALLPAKPPRLYSAFAGELVRSRTFRRRYQPERSGPAAVLEERCSALEV